MDSYFCCEGRRDQHCRTGIIKLNCTVLVGAFKTLGKEIAQALDVGFTAGTQRQLFSGWMEKSRKDFIC